MKTCRECITEVACEKAGRCFNGSSAGAPLEIASSRAALAPATGSPLKGEALEILKHTARTGRYVCDPDADTHLLVTFGYLRDHDAQALAGGMHYYTITHLGKAALRRANTR